MSSLNRAFRSISLAETFVVTLSLFLGASLATPPVAAQVLPPIITKAFGAPVVALSEGTSLTFTIQNPNAGAGLTGVAFTDVFPDGIRVPAISRLTNTCDGTATAEFAAPVTLSGGVLAGGASCTVSVVIATLSPGVKNNSVTVTSTEGGAGNTSIASLTVVGPPEFDKAFGASSIPLNGSTSLTFTLRNPNTDNTLSGVEFTDNLPAGLVIATPNGLTGSCGGGTITATAGGNAISLAGATLLASASCTIIVNVTGTTVGAKVNVASAASLDLRSPPSTAFAFLDVTAPPTIAKAFGAAAIPLNGSTSLTFTLQNPFANVDLAGVAFTDNLPAGLVIATPNGLTGSCGGGTITAPAGGSAISLAGATLVASASCNISINVTGIAVGTKNNITGNVTSTNGGTGNTASASIAVVAPPTIAKAFAPDRTTVGTSTLLRFTLTNPAGNSVALTGVGFTDLLPVGLGIPNGSVPICGGTLTTTGPSSIVLSGATIAVGGTCQFNVTVAGGAIGDFTNTTGNVTSTNGGTGSTASAGLSVVAPLPIPTLSGWALALLSATLGLATLLYMRRRQG